MKISKFLLGIQIYMFIFIDCECLHLKGTFKTDEFFKFLTRFGSQTTDMHDRLSTRAYIYGNISLIDTRNLNILPTDQMPQDLLIMLTVMDYNYFIDYYNKRRIAPKSVGCSMMFENIDKTAYFYECNEKGTQDFIRRVPCQKNNLCVDEDNKMNVIPNHQFTFKIEDINQPRFWYISLVACTKNLHTCKWKYLSDINANETSLAGNNNDNNLSYKPVSYTIAYDIWLVNGHPGSSGHNHFEHQFTYELHDTFEIYLISFLLYLIILPFISYRLYKNFHYMYGQLVVQLVVELGARFFSILHTLVYSYNGRGVRFFYFLGELFETIAVCILILIFISIAKGWTVRARRLKINRRLTAMSFVMLITFMTSHTISLETINPVFNTNSYETVAGYVELSARFVCMIWFLIELKETFGFLESTAIKNDNSKSKVDKISLTNNNYVIFDYLDLLNMDSLGSNRSEHYQQERFEEEFDYVEITRSQQSTYNKLIEHTINENLEQKKEKLKSLQKFYLHYGACCLVWFIYLPLLIFVTSFVSELSRLRLILSKLAQRFVLFEK